MSASEKLQTLIFATLPKIGFQPSKGKVVKMSVSLIRLGLGHTLPKVKVVTWKASERKAPTSYFFHFALIWFPIQQGQSWKNKSCSVWHQGGEYLPYGYGSTEGCPRAKN